MWVGASGAHWRVIDTGLPHEGVITMVTSNFIADPTSALMLAGLDVDEYGQVRARRGDLRRRHRRFFRAARLRKQLA
jgi:hypothetical protein